MPVYPLALPIMIAGVAASPVLTVHLMRLGGLMPR